jgi:hypothetical protein
MENALEVMSLLLKSIKYPSNMFALMPVMISIPPQTLSFFVFQRSIDFDAATMIPT